MTKVSPVRKRNATVFFLTKIAAGIFLRPFFRLTREGLENLPDNQGFILLPKHQRWEDIPLLGLAAPKPLYYIAKVELFLNPVSCWLLSSMGGIPLNRSRPLESRRSLKSVVAFLKNGEGMVIFPEGTYYRDAMGPGQRGLIRMVRSRLKVPLIPVGVRYEKKGWRSRVCIRFGSPLVDDPGRDPDSLLEKIMSEIALLSGLEQAGTPEPQKNINH
ncbi:MAG: lysophospholipid acyltransferase family protein [Pseudomonadota bacterium]